MAVIKTGQIKTVNVFRTWNLMAIKELWLRREDLRELINSKYFFQTDLFHLYCLWQLHSNLWIHFIFTVVGRQWVLKDSNALEVWHGSFQKGTYIIYLHQNRCSILVCTIFHYPITCNLCKHLPHFCMTPQFGSAC